MLPAYYPQRRGDYNYDVTVTREDSERVSGQCCAHLNHAEHLEVDGSRASQSMFPTRTVQPSLRLWVRSMCRSTRGVASISLDLSRGASGKNLHA